MGALQDFRERHPEFSELTDFEIADGLRRRYNRTNSENVGAEEFFEGIGGPKLQVFELGTQAEREAAGTLAPAEGGTTVPLLDDARALTQPPAAQGPPPPPAGSIASQALETFPVLRELGIQFIDSTKEGQQDFRKIETFPADERDNPRPGRPTIEQFDPNLTPQIIAAESLHLLKDSDPTVKRLRSEFVASMTDQQRERLRGQYKHAQKNFGESRPFDKWAEVSGLDQWFGGFIGGVWSADVYTEEQLDLFQRLDGYLRGGPGAGLPEPGTPAAQLTGPSLQAGIEGGRELEESITRFAQGRLPDERIARRAFRKKEDIAKRTREILGDSQKETVAQAKDRREAFQESAFGPDTVLGQITGATMNLIPMALGLFALQNTSDPDVVKDVLEAFGPFDQDPVESGARRARALASGTVGAGGGILGFLGNRTNIEALQSGALTAQGIAEGLMPRDPAFIEDTMGAFGSSALFWIPGVGIAKGAQALAKGAHVAALWAGAGASGVLEAMAEAGNTFQGLIDQGVKPEEAERRADEVFLENSAVVILFNRFGLFGDQAGQFARVTLTAASEGVQEFFQQIISNLAGDDPLLQGAGKAALLGTIVGGAAATATPGGVLPGRELALPGAPPAAPPAAPSAAPSAAPPPPPPPPTPEEEEAGAADVPQSEADQRTVFTPRGEKLQITPRVVDVNDLITSHDDAGNVNPDFPARLQPRDRERKTSQVQIAKIAGNLNPALLGDTPSITEGAPIIARMPKEDAEGNPVLDDQGALIMQDVVISGNARVSAVRQALRDERGRNFREGTVEIAAEFGLTPQQVEPFADPIVVRELAENVDLVEFARQANEPAVAAFSPAEQARSDAARLTADDLALFNPDQSGNPLAASNDPFVRAFLQRIGAEGAAGFTTAEGKPTKQLADRINAAIFAKVYGDDRLIELQAEEADPAIRNILAALQAAAPAFAKAKAIDENLGGLNIPEKIVDAVQLIRDVQARGGTLEQLLEQGDLFGEADAEVQGFARFIAANNRSAERMGRAFTTIAEFLQTEVARQQTGDIFGDKGASLPELLAAANREIDKANADEVKAAGGTQGDIFGANPPRIGPPPGAQPPAAAGGPGGQPPGERRATPRGAASIALEATISKAFPAGSEGFEQLVKAINETTNDLSIANLAQAFAPDVKFGVPQRELGAAVRRVFGSEAIFEDLPKEEADAEQEPVAGAPDADVQPPGGPAPGVPPGGEVPAPVGGPGVRPGRQEAEPPAEPEPTRTIQQVTSAILDAQAQLREELRGAGDLTPFSRDQLSEAAAEEIKGLRKELSAIIAAIRTSDAKTPTSAEKRSAETLRAAAEKMQGTIDSKLDPATAGQNATPRRARIIDSMQADGRRLEKIQARLRNIADALDAGQLPAILEGVKSKAMIEDLMRAELPAGKFLEKQSKRATKAGISTQGQWEQARAALDSLEEAGPTTDSVVEARRLFDKLKRDLVGEKGVGVDFFPTPPERSRDLVDQADAQGAQEGQPGDSVLEPSAGTGNIVEAMADAYRGFEDITITALEVSPKLVEVLRAQAEALRDTHAVDVQQGDFLKYTIEHDVIIMNPPFSKNRDIDHVRHAWDILAPGGRLVAVMSEHAFIASGKKERDFRDWLDDNGGSHVELEPGELADTKVTQRSNVKGRIVEMNKPAAEGEETSGPGVLSERGTTYMIREPEKADQGPDQLTLFAPDEVPTPKRVVPKSLPPAPKVRVKQVATGVIHSGLDIVNSVAEAAHVIAPIRKDGAETFVALVLGAGNKIIRVIRHSIGGTAGAQVDIGILAGSVAETPGAQTVYVAHNHPSGAPSQSKDDREMTEGLANVLQGSGIQLRGGIVVAPGSVTATVLPITPDGTVEGEISIVIPAAPRRVAIPVTERRIRRLARDVRGPAPTTSGQSRKLMAAQPGEGVLLLDHRNRPLKWIPMTTPQMLTLRTGVVGTGASKLAQEIAGQNATAAIAKTNVAFDGSLKALRNVGTFLEANRIRLLDGFIHEKDDSLTSLAERNMPLATIGGTFEMRDVPPGATADVDIEEDSLDQVRRFIDDNGGTVLITTDIDGDLSLDIVELPPKARGQGVGTEFMERLTAHADRFGRDVRLTPSPLDIDRKRENRQADVARLVKFYARFGFQQDHTKSRMFRTAETPPAPTTTLPPGTLAVTDDTQAAAEPGPGRVPLLQDKDLPVDTTGAPRKPASGFGVFKTPIAPDRPLRREPILRNIERDFGVRIYQGRIKRNRSALGFYRNHIEELRLRDNNAIEVAAHEIAHFMDDIDPRFKEAYNDPQYINDILKIASEVDKANEGFAEFVRLFLTQETEAVAQAPGFYDKFIELIEGSRFEKGLIRAQRDMHAWFNQGAINRALSKTGKDRTLNGRVQDIWRAMEDFADRPADRAIASTLDQLQGVKIFEREVTGTIGDADLSPYKIMRLVAGIRGVVRAVFRKGTIGYAENGDVVFTGDGLEQVFKPIADVMDDAMAYFAGKRAAELFRQKREHLFSRSEIQALINQGKDNPRIVKAFIDYQAFNKRMMQFYQDSGLLSPQSRKIIEELNKSYVPFHRILELATGETKAVDRAAFKRLRGGTANVDDIYGNIMQSVAALVDMAVKNKAKQRVYALVMRGKGAAQFAVRIPRETQAVQVDSAQVALKTKAILEELGIDLAEVLPDAGMTFGQDFERAAGQFMTFFTFGNAPIGENIDSVMFNGRRTYFEVSDPLFLKAMLSLGPQATNWALRIGLGFKHTLTFGVTAMPDFLIPNLTRDSVSGWLLRRSNMIPVVSSIQGMVDRMQKSDAYWEYLANGGGFAASVQVETGAARRSLEKLYSDHGIKFKNVITNPRRMVDWWIEFGSAFEYGTRLAEHKASRKQGKSAAESTFRGRDVSTDFAMRGSSDFLRYFTSSVPFLNARMQGMYKLEREVFEKGGKQRIIPGDRAWVLGRRSLLLILPSLILWAMNKDDERYKALEPWVKDLHWVFFVPWQDEPILIMKPFEMGMLFASLPERIAELIDTQDGKQFGDSLWFMLTEQLNMNLIPQVVNPGWEHAVNRNWMGGKIIPEDLANVDNAEQFRPWSSDTSILLGEKIGLPPLLFDHYVKGYLGTMGMYVLMASDGLISGMLPEGPEKEWADRPIIRRFTRSLPLRRTQYEDEFYELRQEVRRVVSTFNKIKNEGRDPKTYLTEEGRQVLFSASKTVTSVSREISLLNGAIRRTRLSAVMSPTEKTAEIKVLRRQRNRLFKDATDALSPAALAKLREKLERE